MYLSKSRSSSLTLLITHYILDLQQIIKLLCHYVYFLSNFLVINITKPIRLYINILFNFPYL